MACIVQSPNGSHMTVIDDSVSDVKNNAKQWVITYLSSGIILENLQKQE